MADKSVLSDLNRLGLHRITPSTFDSVANECRLKLSAALNQSEQVATMPDVILIRDNRTDVAAPKVSTMMLTAAHQFDGNEATM